MVTKYRQRKGALQAGTGEAAAGLKDKDDGFLYALLPGDARRGIDHGTGRPSVKKAHSELGEPMSEHARQTKLHGRACGFL